MDEKKLTRSIVFLQDEQMSNLGQWVGRESATATLIVASTKKSRTDTQLFGT